MALSRALVERFLARALQGGLVALLAIGVLAGNASVAINAALALAVTLVPAVLRRDAGIHLDPGLLLFITAAMFLHAIGMLGVYDAVWWWDHLTHVLSAMLVAGAGYTLVRAVDLHTDRFHIPSAHLPYYLLAFTLAMGLLWEGLELGARVLTDWFGMDVLWVHYGPYDTELDLLFDAVGAVVVALFGTKRLQSAVESVRGWLDRRVALE